jgi:2-deoxy-D-gluconate 3-dehydrogenase
MGGGLSGCDAVVTGAGRGLGRGIALGLAGAGMTVWICSENGEELARTARLIGARGGSVRTRVTDLADPGACADFAHWVAGGAGHLRTLVNNAGVLERIPVTEMSPALWNHVIAVNLTAPFLLTRYLLPHLDPAGGSVINVSSMAGVRGTPGESAYCASKFGIEGFTRCLALELEGTPVSANTITPGVRIKPTSLTEADAAVLPATEREPWNDPELLAPAFVFLAALRGSVQGCRFDAAKLTRALAQDGPEATLNRIEDLAESRDA